ncbi:hypothetical protein [Thalassoroseus pseudoceratinae]|uniref:hypothetical protein n=1 Tax=Thalassoroseus pseudoceratinae TaxID=2713176 RepID=UPI00141E525F|nr:hypothetical protein [Thalassoroseus pseudoceratinae]
MLVASVMVTASFLWVEPAEVVLNRPLPRRRTGRDFEQVLRQPVSVSNKFDSLRSVLTNLSTAYNVAIVLDRRIDPTKTPTIDLQNQPFEIAIKSIAETIGADAVVVGNTIVIGPLDAIGNLPSLIKQRSSEIPSAEIGISRLRRSELTNRRLTIHWNDLDEPRPLLIATADRFGLKVDNPDRIPHDLWPGNTIPEASASEALSLLLLQFGLTFEWLDRGRTIRLVDVPKVVTTEKLYLPRDPKHLAIRNRQERAETAAKDWQQQIPGLVAEPDGSTGRVLVQATAAGHKRLTALLNPETDEPEPNPNIEPAIPLNRRRFLLNVENVPAIAVMKKLEESGVRFTYDKDEMAEAGIDFNQRISINVTNVNANVFLKALFEPLGVAFKYQGTRVTLSPNK